MDPPGPGEPMSPLFHLDNTMSEPEQTPDEVPAAHGSSACALRPPSPRRATRPDRAGIRVVVR
jgi:hypothetical protein